MNTVDFEDKILHRIQKLPSHVADLIAAGEVVGRPASVVKELVENAIDAGASIVTVEIKDGGMTFIRVSDNGSGIVPDDVGLAFLRHATSKIRDAQGLEAIGTLGFRGEALAAISAVSRIELTTREQEANEGVRLLLEGGVPGNVVPVGCPEGTTIIVRDLFFNTPARLKYIKSNRAEGAAVASAVLRAALSHPEVSVRFIKDGKTEYHTPGDFRADSCIYSLFGRDFSSGLIAVKSENSEFNIIVSGYVSSPNMPRGNRSFQFFILNGRPISSKMLQAALEQAYANLLPSGRFPSCVLYITTKLSDVDVNVHPTKMEVKFTSDKEVFDAVNYTVLGALNSEFGIRSSELPKPSGGGFKTATVSEFSQSYGRKQHPQGVGVPQHGTPRAASPTDGFHRDAFSARADGAHHSAIDGRPKVAPTDGLYRDAFSASVDMSGGFEFEPFKLIGEAMNTYIVLEVGASIWFIDKHAAHERIHFNALKSENYDPMSQMLIVPSICRFDAEDAFVLLDNMEFLDNLGFSIESFGDSSIAVRRIPSEIDMDDIETVLSDISKHLEHGSSVDSEKLDKIYRTIACGSSVRAGSLSQTHELEALAARIVSGEITHCPHGRPVMFELSKAALDKEFKRI